MKKVYLAGFDVFYPDAIKRGERLKHLCEQYGLKGSFPLDNTVPSGMSGREAASWIYQKNIQALSESAAVLANLNNFRGHEPDSGTVFEVGFAVARGIPVWAYFSDDHPLKDKIATDKQGLCAEGFTVEDFGLPKNLMLAASWAGYSLNAEDAVTDLAAYLSRQDAI